MNKRMKHALIPLALALALFAAACGGDSGDTTTTADGGDTTTTTAGGGGDTTTTSTTAAPEPVQGISEDGVVKFGAWIAQSGPLAVAANYALGAQAYLDTVNDAGGVNGYTFEFEVIDDGGDPTKTVTAATQLWEEDQVFGFLLPYGSSPMSAVLDYINENQIPVLFPSANPDIYFPEGEPPPANIFGYLPPYDELVAQLATFAAEDLGIETLAIVHTNDAFGAAGPEAMETLAGELGIEVVETVGYDGTETNFAPLGRRIADSGADAVLVWAIVGAPQVMSAAVDSGYAGTWLLNEAFRGGFFFDSISGLETLDGNTYIGLTQLQPFHNEPILDQFNEVFPAAYPDGDPLYALPGWTGAEMMVKAVGEATADGSPLTWESLSAALESWTDVDVAAAVGMTYSPEQHIGGLYGQILLLEGTAWSPVTEFELLPGLAQYAG